MTVAAPCQHLFDIEEPHGPTARGVCRNCGEVKVFVTSYGYRYSNAPLFTKERDE